MLPFLIVRSKQVKGLLLTNRDFNVWSCTCNSPIFWKRTCTNLSSFATFIPFFLFDYSHERHLDVTNSFFFQFCGFEILAKFTISSKMNWMYIKTIKIQILLLQDDEILFLKNCWPQVRFFISIVWLWGKWTSHHPQEDLAKFGYR